MGPAYVTRFHPAAIGPKGSPGEEGGTGVGTGVEGGAPTVGVLNGSDGFVAVGLGGGAGVGGEAGGVDVPPPGAVGVDAGDVGNGPPGTDVAVAVAPADVGVAVAAGEVGVAVLGNGVGVDVLGGGVEAPPPTTIDPVRFVVVDL